MDFGLSEEQVLLKDTIKRFLEGECPTTRVRSIMESQDGHDPALWRSIAELGIPGLMVPVELGGSGLDGDARIRDEEDVRIGPLDQRA